jgi:hypothetical protein
MISSSSEMEDVSSDSSEADDRGRTLLSDDGFGDEVPFKLARPLFSWFSSNGRLPLEKPNDDLPDVAGEGDFSLGADGAGESESEMFGVDAVFVVGGSVWQLLVTIFGPTSGSE